MIDLRKAAEMALSVLLDPKSRADEVADAVKTIRQALDLQIVIDKGTKAWADVPDASKWVDDLRGNVDKVDTSEERVYKTKKSIHEPVAWMYVEPNNPHKTVHTDGYDYKQMRWDDEWFPVYTAPPKREWVGLTDDEIRDVWDHSFSIWGVSRGIEAKLKEKNT